MSLIDSTDIRSGKKNSELRHGITRMSNDLARAYWPTRSVWEMRIVTAVAALVDSRDSDFKTYRIPISELCGDKNMRRNYSEVKDAAEMLMHRTVRMIGPNGNFRIYTIFAVCGIEDGDVIAGFHPDLKPMFLNLQRRYTLYRAADMSSLRSAYSQKLFLLLKSWRFLREVTVAVRELHAHLFVPDSLRKNYGNFKKRVLIPCHKNICECTDIKYSWEEVKDGKSINCIKFIFEKK